MNWFEERNSMGEIPFVMYLFSVCIDVWIQAM